MDNKKFNSMHSKVEEGKLPHNITFFVTQYNLLWSKVVHQLQAKLPFGLNQHAMHSLDWRVGWCSCKTGEANVEPRSDREPMLHILALTFN